MHLFVKMKAHLFDNQLFCVFQKTLRKKGIAW